LKFLLPTTQQNFSFKIIVANAELDSKFKVFPQDYKGTKKAMNELNEKENSMKVKLEKSSTIKKLWIACQPLL